VTQQQFNYNSFIAEVREKGLEVSTAGPSECPDVNLYIWAPGTPHHSKLQSHLHLVLTRTGVDTGILAHYHITLRDVPGNAVNDRHFFDRMAFNSGATGTQLLERLSETNPRNRMVIAGRDLPEMKAFLQGWDDIVQILLRRGGVFDEFGLTVPQS
jgi:hypothetical protein